VIKTVFTILAELGLWQVGQRRCYNVSITKGDVLLITVFTSDHSFLHVRASELVNLQSEFRAHREAWATYPQFVPRPLGYLARDGWEIIVTEGVFYQPLSRNLTLTSGPVQGILEFFATASRQARSKTPAKPHGCLLANLHDTFKNTPFASVLQPWLTVPGRGELEAVSHIPQHGDFVLENLGNANSKLVIFDWEDFGKIALAGLDLCSLFISTVEFDAREIRLLMEVDKSVSNRHASLLKQACVALDLDFQLFRRLIPLYALIFLRLKENYTGRIQQRTAALLQQLST
jgi:hypothetical protein